MLISDGKAVFFDEKDEGHWEEILEESKELS